MLKQLAECAAAAAIRGSVSPGYGCSNIDGEPDPETERLVTAFTYVFIPVVAEDSSQVSTDAHPENRDTDNSDDASAASREVPRTAVTVGPFQDLAKDSMQVARASTEAHPCHSCSTGTIEAGMDSSATCTLPTPAVTNVAGASSQVCEEAHPASVGRDDSEKNMAVSPSIGEIPPKVAIVRPSQDPAEESTQVARAFAKARSENGSSVDPGQTAMAFSTTPQLPTKVVTVGPFGGPAKITIQTTQVPVQVNWDLVTKPGSKKGPESRTPTAYAKVSPELIVGIEMEAEKHGPLPAMREETVRFSNTMQICSLCHKVFSNPSNLRQHYAIVHSASAERPFGCTVCSKRFNTESNLRQHRRTHTGERPFPCPHCPRAFSTSTNLRQHERIHTGERPFACSDCPRAFSTSSNLRQHQRIHSDERPFECRVCEKRFRSSTNLRQHGKIHDNGVAPAVVSEEENHAGGRTEPTETGCEPKQLWVEPEQMDKAVCPEESLPRASTVSNAQDPTAVQNVHSIMFLQVSGENLPNVGEVLQGLRTSGHV
ncbi:unnamed protein product [Ixodes pacificus]